MVRLVQFVVATLPGVPVTILTLVTTVIGVAYLKARPVPRHETDVLNEEHLLIEVVAGRARHRRPRRHEYSP